MIDHLLRDHSTLSRLILDPQLAQLRPNMIIFRHVFCQPGGAAKIAFSLRRTLKSGVCYQKQANLRFRVRCIRGPRSFWSNTCNFASRGIHNWRWELKDSSTSKKSSNSISLTVLYKKYRVQHRSLAHSCQ